MTYSYWKLGRQNEMATFDVFFRKNPFEGEFTVFAGLENALELLKRFKFAPEHIAYDFATAETILKETGFRYYTVFRERKAKQLPL